MASKQEMFVKKMQERIERGEFPYGTYLPSERDLATQYKLGRITIRGGLKLLQEQHVLQIESTKGYKVIRIPGMPDQTTLNIGGLWCSGHSSDHTYKLYNVASQEARRRGYTLFLHHALDDSADWAAKLGELLEEDIAGLMLIPTYSPKTGKMTLANHRMILALRQSGIPLVLLDRDFPERDLPSVLNDEYRGGQMVAEHFAALGHKKVVLLARLAKYYISDRRFGGFIDRCAELNLDLEIIDIPSETPAPQDFFRTFRKNLTEIKKRIADFGATAILLNAPAGATESIMRCLEVMDLDFLLYGNTAHPGKRNVWCAERQIQEISRQGILMLLDEIHCGGRRPAHQIKLPPVIRKVVETDFKNK